MSSATVDHTYRYAFASHMLEHAKGGRVQLATSGGQTQFPYFFQGQLKRPRLTALLLRTLSNTVTTRFHIPPAIVERKVKLPMRWLQGFVEVQAYQSRMERWAQLSKVETLRFLRSVPRSVMAKTVYWSVPSGRGLRLSQRGVDGSLRVAGIERLHLLDDLAPFADGLTVFSDARGDATEWRLHFGPLNFHQLTRWAKVLREVSRVSVEHATTCAGLITRSLHGDPTKAPRDVSALLELLFELLSETNSKLDDARAKSYLAGLTSGGKTRKLVKQLLAG